jgi:phosphoglycolate phosphatase-like HAD superfamily hydrolase
MGALVLDFDGVISDSAREAFVVALRTHCEIDPRSALCPLLEGPAWGDPDVESLYRRFLGLMPLGNRAEDYGVALRALEAEEPIGDQGDYDAYKARQDPASLRAFHERFYRVRAGWARTDRTGWLSLMAPYPAFLELLRRRGRERELAIATSKDRGSVRELLAHYGLADLFPTGRVLDKEAGISKRSHLERLRALLGVPYAGTTFVDDKVNHLESVAPLGVRCVLAAWGYNGPREHALARERGFVVCPLERAEELLF